ncbi:hypothetical protein TRIUR3_19701 [Triticum urartu]|uniref:Uncharacterized protein n=1 Tax=Triticum urartu TaxID=4572 RepID=M7ZM08_TRIUA|nr:hypothetical protein TRIUR3_19701 [Triticum urartu]
MANDGAVSAIPRLPWAIRLMPTTPGQTLAPFPPPPCVVALSLTPTRRHHRHVDPAATGLPSSRQDVQKHPRRRLLRPRPVNQAGKARTLAIKLVVTAYIIVAAVDCRHFDRPRPHRPMRRDRCENPHRTPLCLVPEFELERVPLQPP